MPPPRCLAAAAAWRISPPSPPPRCAGMPNSHSFHLPFPTEEEARRWSADDEPRVAAAEGTSVVEN